MAKLTLNPITSGYGSTTALNDNFDLIETALENTLSRDGTSPNTMSADLDMNGHRILNELATTGDGFIWNGDWLTATAYSINDLVYVPASLGHIRSGYAMICTVAHTSGTWATDYTSNYWDEVAARGASGAGAGDLVSTNNLSDVTSAGTSLTNLGITTTGKLVATASSVTAAFDAIAPTTTQGDISYHNGTDNVRLGPGTAGQFLKTQGAAANPIWADVGFSAVSLAASGYIKFTNGFIIQWGTTPVSSSSSDVAGSFPLAFPTNAWSIVFTPGVGTSGYFATFPSLSVTGFTYAAWSATSTRAANITSYYIAVGN